MVITMLEARVAEDRVAALEQAYRENTREIPAAILETFLVRDAHEPGRFRIVTVWSTRAALDAMRNSGVTPTGVRIFQAAGATPDLSVLEVRVHRQGHNSTDV